jgi:hypothetical protein
MVSPIASHPHDQGNSARIFTLGRLLQRAGLIVHFLWYPLEGWRAAQQAAMAATWDYMHVAPPVAINLAPTGPGYHGLDDWCPAEVVNCAVALQRRWRFDAVICHYMWFSRVLEALGNATLKIIDTHDVFADRHQRLSESGVAPTWYSTSLAEEDRGLARADIVFAIQPDEAAEFRARGHRDVRVIGHLPRTRFRLVHEHRHGMITAGYLASGNPLNHAAFKTLRAHLPQAPRDMRLVVGGAICDQLESGAPFTPLGRLEEVEAFYDLVDVALNPMSGGTGLKIKSVEALAQGVPLVATLAAMTGLPAEHALHRLGGPEDVATCLRETRFGVTLRRELAAASRRATGAYAAEVRVGLRRFMQDMGGLRA